MSRGQSQQLDLPDPAATRAAARSIAPHLRRGDLVTLSGPIGAGKSEFARALIRHRAWADIEVPSPSFTLLQTYAFPDIDIAHVDLYRLGDASEIVELGLDELAADHLMIVEWPERAVAALPVPTLELTFSLDGEGRRLSVIDRAGRWVGLGAAHV